MYARFMHGLCKNLVTSLSIYSRKEGACAAARREGYIPEAIKHIHEGAYVNESGDILRGLLIFNVPAGEERYVAAVLRDKARQVGEATRKYVEDLGEEYPQELWTMLQFSL
jgi:hypothetical protein